MIEDSLLRMMEYTRWIFWCFVLFHASICCSILNTTFETAKKTQVFIVFRVMILWVLCRTGRHKKRVILHYIVAGICYAYYWGFTFVLQSLLWQNSDPRLKQTDDNHYKQMAVALFQTCTDIVLIVGHCWDEDTSMLVTINCRLFYCTFSCSLLHFLL